METSMQQYSVISHGSVSLAESSQANQMTGSVLASRLHQALIGILLAASLVPIWSVTYFPSQNGPWHLLVCKMLHDYFAGTATNYFDYYELAPHLIPHLLHTILVTLVSFIVPVLIAHKLVISLYVVLLPLSVFWFLSVVDPRKTIYGYASFLFVYNLPLMRGYHDYSLGIPVVLFTLAYWLRTWERSNAMRTAILAGLILIAYLSHIFHFLILGLAISFFTLYQTRRVSRVVVALVPFLPALLLVADFAFLLMGNSVWMSGSDLEIFAPHQALEHFVRFAYTLSPSAAVIAMVPLIFIACAIGLAIQRAVAEYRCTGQVAGGSFLLLLGVLVVAYFAMPHKFFGWHFANTRFIPFVLTMALACATPYGLRVRRVFLATTVVAAFASYALLTVQFVRADRTIGEYVSAVEWFRPGGLLYPIDFRADGYGQIQPLTRAHEYYHIYKGGANGRGIAMFNTLTPVPYRVYPVVRRFPVWRPDSSDERAAILAAHYDHVLSWGTNALFAESLTKAKFRLVHQRGNVYFYTNEVPPDTRLMTHAGAHE
jgi:hypothetical protein